jgi:ResB-like family
MDPTVIKQESTLPNPAGMPTNTNLKQLAWQGLQRLASLRITVVLFVLSLLLVFWGTLAQADLGVWTVVNRYFRSFFVWIPFKVVFFNAVENTTDVIPFPGGLLLGGAMLINLLAAHAVRFKLSWSRAGILLIHAGIIIMMLGEVVTYLFADEGNMIIQEGHTVNHVIHARQAELAVIRTVDAIKDDVVVVPSSILRTDAKIQDSRLPFTIEVLDYMVNSKLVNPLPGRNVANKGLGLSDMAQSVPEVSGVDPKQQHDIPSTYVRLRRDGHDLGTWLLSSWFSDYMGLIQEVIVDGKTYQIALRYKQSYRPYSMHLTKFKHDVYPGTETPKDYHAYIHLNDPANGVDRDVEIYMNAPLRYRGETFYQSGVNTDVQGNVSTTLQVVRNPGWLMPYISCGVVGIGLLIHFGLTLYRFIDRRIVR